MNQFSNDEYCSGFLSPKFYSLIEITIGLIKITNNGFFGYFNLILR